MAYTDSNGLIWTRSTDLKQIVSSAGDIVVGNEQMSDEYLVATHYKANEPIKTDAERIAELEAQLAALLARLS